MTRPLVSLQAAIGPGSPPSNLFIIGASLLGGPNVLAGAPVVGQGTWVELVDRCYHLSTRRGRQRLLEAYQAGTLGASLDNADSQLGPIPPSGNEPLTDDFGATLTDDFGAPLTVSSSDFGWRVRTMRAIRVTFTHNGVTHPVIYAYADQWKQELEYPKGATTSLTATDAFKIFTRIDPLEGPFVGGGEDTGARIHRILDVAAWPTPLRDIDVGNSTHQATNLAQPIATQMRLAADSERGDLYVDGRGYPTFRRRMSRYVDLRSRTAQWVIGDGAGEMNPAEFTVTQDDDLVRNEVNVARVGGSMVHRITAEAAAHPETRSTYTRTDLTLADDLQVIDHADRVLRLFAAEQSRVDTVTFEPDGVDDDQMWEMICGARFGDRVTCNLRHTSGTLYSNDYFIEGIDHDVPFVGAMWRTTFALADASMFPTRPFTIGVSLLGGLAVLV